MMRATTEVTVSALAAMVVHAVARGLDTVNVVVEIDDPSPRRDCEIDEPIPVRPTEAADRVAELEREVERLRARLSAAHDAPAPMRSKYGGIQCADTRDPMLDVGAARAAGWRAACERIAKECDDAHRAELALARDYEARGMRGSEREYEAGAFIAQSLARAARRIASEDLC